MSLSEDPSRAHNAMRRESIAAIRRGDALPTPHVAAKEGGEMFSILKAEIEKLDATQLESLYRALRDAEKTTTLEAIHEKLTHKEPFVKNGVPVIPTTLGFLFGTTVSGGNIGVGVLAAGAVGMLSRVPFRQWPEEKRRAAARRIQRVETLIEKVQKEQQANPGH